MSATYKKHPLSPIRYSFRHPQYRPRQTNEPRTATERRPSTTTASSSTSTITTTTSSSSSSSAITMLFIALYAAVVVAFLSPATAARTARSDRRDVWIPTNPEAFEVDLGFDRVGRYVITIGMVSRSRHKSRIADHRCFMIIRANLSLKPAISASSCPHRHLTQLLPRLDALTALQNSGNHHCKSIPLSTQTLY